MTDQFDATDAEQAVLEILWELGSANIREITDKVYPDGSESEYATTKKLLARLENKKMVIRDRTEIAHTFSTAVSRSDLMDRRLQKLADSLCGGSKAPLLMQLLGGAEKISKPELEALKKLVQTASKKKRSNKSSKSKKR